MTNFRFVTLLCLLSWTLVSAFVSSSTITTKSSSTITRGPFALTMVSSQSSSSETEAERLLRKARELRAAAEQAEQQVHGNLTQKKAQRDAQTDALIAQILLDDDDNDNDIRGTVDRLRNKKCSMATLERILLRLDERHVRAQGWEHVQGKVGTDGQTVEFVRVADAADPRQVQRLQGKVEQLLAAVAVLDDEFRAQKQAKGQSYVAHAEEAHWGGGKAAEYLQGRIKEIRRERSEHFQARQKELQEAQRRKEDHKFDGYNDMGTLN